MQRYFVAADNWLADRVLLQDEAHHIIRVMRLNLGDSIICIHPDGRSAQCQITEIDEGENQVLAKIVAYLEEDRELPIQVVILQSIPKGSKLDLIIQKGTELGATAFYLFQSERSLVKWNQKKVIQRLDRYRKIAQEASEQSERQKLPEIHYIEDLESFLSSDQLQSSCKMVAYEGEARQQTKSNGSFSNELRKCQPDERLTLAVGPEGGFTDEEIALFKENGFVTVRLGRRILRSETASLYALSSISYHFEELGI